jgi:hypothetical protein
MSLMHNGLLRMFPQVTHHESLPRTCRDHGTFRLKVVRLLYAVIVRSSDKTLVAILLTVTISYE